jgi:hypothetical protein
LNESIASSAQLKIAKLSPTNAVLTATSNRASRLVTRQAVTLDRFDHPFAKVHRIGFRHPCWPPTQPTG